MSSIEIYSDINKVNPLEKSRIVNIESIKNSIKNILNIKDKEVLFDFSNQNLPSYLFKNFSEANAFALRTHIIEVLSKEPRISIDIKVSDVSINIENNAYIVYVNYYIKGLDINIETTFKI